LGAFGKLFWRLWLSSTGFLPDVVQSPIRHMQVFKIIKALADLLMLVTRFHDTINLSDRSAFRVALAGSLG
jgi:hypothetical protein